MTKRILMRAAKSPFEVIPPATLLRRNMIGRNSGNLIFSHAAHRALEVAEAEVVAGGLHWRPGQARRINEEFDVFVVPLANAFRLSFEKELKALTAMISKLDIPVVVLGVGAQGSHKHGATPLKPIAPSVKAFVGAVLDRSATIGVRGEFTAEYLSELGFSDIETIGCPSMFMNGTRLHVSKKVPRLDAESKVAINITPYRKRMGSVLKRHLPKYPNLTYVAQDELTLRRLVKGDKLIVRPTTRASEIPAHTSHIAYRDKKVRFFIDVGPWLSFMAQQDFSFGTRIHGNMAALMAGTPAFVFTHDWRTLELAQYFEIPHSRMRDLKRIDAAELHAGADYSRLNNGHRARLRTYLDFIERNGLDHIWSSGEERTNFDERLAAIEFPPAVGG
ncbi:MAG: polysaccharide pyruvyl transferase family protein [bacterium]|nr:polysaccharide pyruvyl transferase family protein [bacterium]